MRSFFLVFQRYLLPLAALLGLGIELGACNGPGPARPSASASVSAAMPQKTGPAISSAPPLEPASSYAPELLEARLKELNFASDFRNTYWLKPNPAWAGFPRPMPKKGPLLRAEIKKAMAFAYHFQPMALEESGECHVFDKKGRFCPHIVEPGVELQEGQFKRMLAFLAQAEAGAFRESESASRPRSRCEFDPHHFVLFLDAENRPVGQLEICFTCGEWLAQPHSEALSGDAPAMMYSEERRFLLALCDELKLPGCFVGDEVFMEAFYKYRQNIYFDSNGDASERAKQELLKKQSGVDGAGALKNASDEDKIRLCALAQEYLSFSFIGSRNFALCEQEHRALQRWSFQECISQFPRCSAKMEQAESCLRKIVEPPSFWCKDSLPDECKGLEDCTLGFSIRDLKKESKP